MPSPFPGMDPYLEGDLWQEFHETLAGAIRAQLMPLLAPWYVALLAKRYVLDRPALGVLDAPPARIFYPDVHVVAPREAVSTAVAIPETPGITTPSAEIPNANYVETPQISIELRDGAQRRLVTVIKILSPANKYGDGAREYVDRRTELLRTEVHLLELDLLRQGAHSARRRGAAGNLLGLPQSPPAAAVHAAMGAVLARHAPDVPLDLQAAVAACFALVGYERLIDYSAVPPPP